MATWKAFGILLASVFSASVSAAAQEVGTATAVNQRSEGSSGLLTVGAHITHKEHIHTSPSGSVQIRFLDKSTLSVAPNTSIVIDDFVYNPNSNSGHSVTKLTEGALRYVGGELSHLGEATISTPAAAIGIRGGIATVTYGPDGATVTNQNGKVTITNGAGTITIIQNFTVTILNWYTPPGMPIRTEARLAEHYVRFIISKYNQDGGVKGYHGQTIACGTTSTPACPLQPWMSTYGGDYDATQVVIQGVQHGTGQTPPPPPPDRSRVR